MNYFKNISRYKLINQILFFLSIGVIFSMYVGYGKWCENESIYCYYNFYDAVYNPLYESFKILTVILGLLLFVPSHIFRKWLFYIAPIIILITINRVMAVSVYTSGIGSIDKIHMAKLGMFFLAILTVLFVGGHLIYDKQKRKNDPKNITCPF